MQQRREHRQATTLAGQVEEQRREITELRAAHAAAASSARHSGERLNETLRKQQAQEGALRAVLAALGIGFAPIETGVTMNVLTILGGWESQRRVLLSEVRRRYRDYVDTIFEERFLPALAAANDLAEFDTALGAFMELRIYGPPVPLRPRDRGMRQ